MGLRFDLATANWIAYLISPGGRIPRMSSRSLEVEATRNFLRTIRNGYISSEDAEGRLHQLAQRADRLLDVLAAADEHIPNIVLGELREYFGHRPWTAMLIPGGHDPNIAEFISSPELLRSLVQLSPTDPGLILQVEDPPHGPMALTDVFPAFRAALNDPTEWPGLLVWNDRNQSEFFPFAATSIEQVQDRAHWIVSNLMRGSARNLRMFKRFYDQIVTRKTSRSDKIHIIHLSDLHIGSNAASLRLPRVQQLVRGLIYKLRGSGQVLTVISGDLMDNPTTNRSDQVREFLESISMITDQAPIWVLGNHDVRQQGLWRPQYRTALDIPGVTTPVFWVESAKIGIILMNTVIKGRLARGFVGERQMINIANEIDRHPDREAWPLIAVLHHHPVAIDRPEWYVKPFYEKVFGRYFEMTDALEDAHEVLEFLEGGRTCAILHGHKHIPKFTLSPGGAIPIFGCGSSVGKVDTLDGRTFMSVNVITLDLAERSLAGRLLAERITGTGLRPMEGHEIVYTGKF